jgi:hypothetical protein
MTFRANGTSVVRSTSDGEDVGVALTFDDRMAQRIADALNAASTEDGGRSVTDPLTGEQVAELNVRDQTLLSDVLGEGSFVKVVGPYATAEMTTPGGRQIRSLAEGAVLPGDVTAGTARHLIDVGLAQLVQGASAAEVHEGAPTERHRVEAAAMTGHGPTVGHPQPGTAAYDYDQDPEAAARAAAAGGLVSPPQMALSGAGEAPLPEDPDTAGEPPEGGKPDGRSSEARWREYHARQLVAQGWDEDDAKAKADDMSKAELVAQYK